MLEIPERVYGEYQVKLEKATVKSHETIMLTTDRGVPLRQYDPKLIRTLSRFKGVRTPRNEWNRRLRTKIALEQTSRTSTSKREEEKSRHHPRGANAKTGVYVPIIHMMQGDDGPKKNRANLQRTCELIL